MLKGPAYECRTHPLSAFSVVFVGCFPYNREEKTLRAEKPLGQVGEVRVPRKDARVQYSLETLC